MTLSWVQLSLGAFVIGSSCLGRSCRGSICRGRSCRGSICRGRSCLVTVVCTSTAVIITEVLVSPLHYCRYRRIKTSALQIISLHHTQRMSVETGAMIIFQGLGPKKCDLHSPQILILWTFLYGPF